MEEQLIFGMPLAELEDWALTICFTGLILFMLFIIGNLAKESKAGKYGAMWLFIALGLGFVGFVAKGLIQRLMGIA